MTLGQEIKAARQASGMTQVVLAKRVRIPQSFLSLIEGGKKQPSLALLRRIAKRTKTIFTIE